MYFPHLIGGAIDAWLTGGIKALRFLFSARYRQRAREHWQLFPQRRTRGIIRMVWGTILDVAIIWALLSVKWHR